VTDHIKFPFSYASGTSEGAKRFNKFEELLMHNWSTVLVNPTMWFIVISHVPKGLKGLGRENILNREGPNQYDQLVSNQTNLISSMTEKIGCMMAHSVEQPTISVMAGRDEVRLGGYYPGLVANNINEENNLRVEFRETHSSISEFIIRPWIEAVAKFGLIARPVGDPRNVKTKLYFFQLGKVGPGTDPIYRKIWCFHDCVPTDLTTQRYAHDGSWASSDTFFTTNWIYSKYDVTDVRFENVSDLYKAHAESASIRPTPSQRTSGRVGENDTPVGKISTIG